LNGQTDGGKRKIVREFVPFSKPRPQFQTNSNETTLLFSRKKGRRENPAAFLNSARFSQG
jgi:hypothetical protein